MPRREIPSGRLDTAVLLTVLYADLFDHVLSESELLSYLVEPAEPAELGRAVVRLTAAGWLEPADGLVAWKGRAGLGGLRRERRQRSVGLWDRAREVADELARIPFLRMVAVCGSLAVDNATAGADIDLFLITANDRLWVVQWRAMRCRHRAARRGVDACPNYLLTLRSLAVERRDLHTAREVAQVVPLWGAAAYQGFLDANRWISGFLPNLDLTDRRRFLAEPARPNSVSVWERRLGGRGGDLLDRGLYRLLLAYYPWRLRRRGVAPDQVRAAYRPDRQEVVGGGYGSAIRDRFLERVGERLGEAARHEAESRLFPRRAAASPVPLYGRQLEERYGARP